MYGYVSDGMYTANDFTWDGAKWVLNEGVADASSVIGATYLRPGAMKLKDLTGDGKVTSADRKSSATPPRTSPAASTSAATFTGSTSARTSTT